MPFRFTVYQLSRALLVFSIGLFVISGCNTTNETDTSDAVILSFSIDELPSAIFEIDQSKRLISVSNLEQIEVQTLDSLTATFTVSNGGTVFVADTLQESGASINSFSNGVEYTIVSEDGLTSNSYFVYLTESLPKNYFIEGPISVLKNPSGIAPLTAEISLTTKRNSTVSLTVTGESELSKSFRAANKQHSFPVMGLYAGKENILLLEISDDFGNTYQDSLSIKTSKIPSFFPEVTIETADRSLMEPGLHFSELHIGNSGRFNSYPFVYDDNGDIRWYVDLSELNTITWPIKFTDRNTFYAISWNRYIEFDLMGNEIRRFVDERYNMHHEILELPNGNLIIAVSKIGTTIIKNDEEIASVDDYIIELDGTTGSLLNEWDMTEILDVSRVDVVDGKGDWLHMNAIWYDDSDHSLIISGRNQGIIKVNWDNELKWIIAPHQGWGSAGRDGSGESTGEYLLTAVDASNTPYENDVQEGTTEHPDFNWTWGQHAPMVLPNGNIFVFDNGTNRNFGNASEQYSRGVEYQVDEENMTIKQIWNYGQELGTDGFSNIISDVDLLPETKNRLIAPGYITTSTPSKAKVVEVIPSTNQVVFESTLEFKDLLSSGAGWGNIDIAYRAERVTFLED